MVRGDNAARLVGPVADRAAHWHHVFQLRLHAGVTGACGPAEPLSSLNSEPPIDPPDFRGLYGHFFITRSRLHHGAMLRWRSPEQCICLAREHG